MQDVCVGISVSGASRATCARSLYENFLRKVSVSRSPQQDPVGALVQDRCIRISCARCLCQDLLGSCRNTCAKSACGSLVQDLSVRTSASGSCRITCARSLYADLLHKISASGSLHRGPVGPLAQDLCVRISCARCLVFKISSAESCRSTCARSVYQDLLCKMSVSRSPQ